MIIPLEANNWPLGQILHSMDLLNIPDATLKSLKSEYEMLYVCPVKDNRWQDWKHMIIRQEVAICLSYYYIWFYIQFLNGAAR